jgi:hypothetical protein
MKRYLLGGLCVLAVTLTGPATAAADLIDATLTSAQAQARVCADKPASGAGVVQRTVTATANGLIRATLTRGGGDWDLAVFDKASGRRVAGSASFGANELAEGVAAKGQTHLLQAAAGPADPIRSRSTRSRSPCRRRRVRRSSWSGSPCRRRRRATPSTRPGSTRPSTRRRRRRT